MKKNSCIRPRIQKGIHVEYLPYQNSNHKNITVKAKQTSQPND